MLVAPKRLNLRTSNLTCMFPGIVQIWCLIFFEKGASVKIRLVENMHSHERLLHTFCFTCYHGLTKTNARLQVSCTVWFHFQAGRCGCWHGSVVKTGLPAAADFWLENAKRLKTSFDCRNIPLLLEMGVAESNGVSIIRHDTNCNVLDINSVKI